MKSVLSLLLLLVATSVATSQTTPEARHEELLKSSLEVLADVGLMYLGGSEKVSPEGFRGAEQSFSCEKKIGNNLLTAELSKFGNGGGHLALSVSGGRIQKREATIFLDLAVRMAGLNSKGVRKELVSQAAAVYQSIQQDSSEKKQYESGWFNLPGDTNARYLLVMTDNDLESEDSEPSFLITFDWTTEQLETIDSNSNPTAIKWKRGERLLNLVAWNVESGGNDPAVIAKQMEDFAGADVFALNEVNKRNVSSYTEALGDNYQAFVSQTGRADHLAILYDSKRFELLEEREMARYDKYLLNNGTHRSPIYVRLKERKTGFEFLFMTNHLARRDEGLRRQQATGLREWARDNDTPIIAMGDFNFDYSFRKKSGNQSFDVFLRDDVWKWIKPTPLVDTNWSGKTKDSYPDSMLDFVFVANAAKEFESRCEIVVREGDFPDDETTSDHRATRAEIKF